MERNMELLPTETPFQFILAYLKKVGAKNLESIPLEEEVANTQT
jgi:hypothetical protein